MRGREWEFRPIEISDKEWLTTLFREDNRQLCEYTFSSNFTWREPYAVKVASVKDCAVIMYESDGTTGYAFPIGAGDKREVIEQLLEMSESDGKALRLSPICKEDRDKLEEWFPERFTIVEDRDRFDYVYTTERLSLLQGKKLHGKRNHIARFKDQGQWSYEMMTEHNLMECMDMASEWMKERGETTEDGLEEEMTALSQAILNFNELGLTGGLLRLEGRVIAFTIGEPLNKNTFVVHFEKAFGNIQGAYPMINQQFVLNQCQNFLYVNREEDTGNLGLRKAKLSYGPENLVEKYSAVSI